MLKKILLTVFLLIISVNSLFSITRIYKIYHEVFFETTQLNQIDTWKKAEIGHTIVTNSKVKTGVKSTAVIDIDNKVTLYLRENTVLQFYRLDERIEIELIEGSITIKAVNYYENFYIKTVQASLKVFSKHCLIKNIRDMISVSVFDSFIKVKIKGNDILVNQGNGLEINPLDITFDSFPLPDSPIAEYPHDNSIITPGINLKWEKVEEAIFYRIEVAKDLDFVELVKFKETDKTEMSIDDLTEGTYYWRVSSINRKNLEGIFFDNSKFILQKDQAAAIYIKDKEDDKEKVPDTAGIPFDDEEIISDDIPVENTTNSLILGGIILISLVVLLII